MKHNLYTIKKIRNVVGKQLSADWQNKFNNLLLKLYDNGISTGEPSTGKNNFMIIYGGKCNVGYTMKFTETGIIDLEVSDIDNKKHNFTYNWNMIDTLIETIRSFIEQPNNVQSIDELEQRLDEISKYEKDWSGYCCNEVSPLCIEKAREVIGNIIESTKCGLLIGVYAIADGGHAYKRPPETSKSGIEIDIHSEDKRLIFEINEDDGIVETSLLGTDTIIMLDKLDYETTYTEFKPEELYDKIQWLDIGLFREHKLKSIINN